MSRIMINDTLLVEGAFSFSAQYDQGQNPPLVKIQGTLSTKNGYLPNIYKIENERYALYGVHVHEEGYGSEEDEIAYRFTAKSYAIADSLREVHPKNG